MPRSSWLFLAAWDWCLSGAFALRRRGGWGYRLGPLLVASVVAASWVAGAAAQSGIAVTAKPPRVDRWPCRIVAASTLRKAFEQGWERSKTIRGQCAELAEARAVVALEWVATDSLSHAKTAMAVRGGVVAATVGIPPVGEMIVLLAHELQHVIEKARGLDVEAEAKRPDSGVWKAAGGYETLGAIAVSRQVAAELRVVVIRPTTNGRTDEVGSSKRRQYATSIQPPTGGHLVGLIASGDLGAQQSSPGPLFNLQGGAFQQLIERMWRDSPTFREQCRRLAAESQLRITIRAESRPSLSGVRARGEVSTAKNGRVSRVDIVLMSPRDTIELIGHEIEHVIERVEGVRLREHGCLGTTTQRDFYESCRAVEIGRRVAREVEESQRRRTNNQ